MTARVNCYLIEADDYGQIESADLVHSRFVDKAKTADFDLDKFMWDTYSATLYAVYSKYYPRKKSADKGAVSLRFYKNH